MTVVAIFNVPAHGHTNPTLPVVSELVRRGSYVQYFTTPEFRAAVTAAGAEFIDVSPLLPLDADRPYPNHFNLADTLLSATEQIVDALLPKLRTDPPNVIVHDSMCPWGKVLAQLLNVPSVGSVTTFVLSPLAAISSPALVGEVLRMWLGSVEARRSFRTTARRLRARYSQAFPSPLGVLSQFGTTNVVYTSRALQPASRWLGRNFVFVGPSLPEQSAQLDFALRVDHPLVYVSLGTLLNDAPAFFRACFDAFDGQDVHVVMAIGRTVNRADLGAVPTNVVIRPHVPQLAVLAQASAFVTHGGMNSVHEALAHGVPMLVVPQGSDQMLVGKRVQAVGAGRMLARQDVTASALREGVQRLLGDDQVSAATKRVGREALALGGAQRAAEVILSASRRYSLIEGRANDHERTF